MHLIAMKGHPATGKSTLSRMLARRLGWPLIDKDDVKDHTVKVSDGNVPSGNVPSGNVPSSNVLAYDILWQVVETQLQLGLSTIVDSPLSYPIAYTTAQHLAAQYDAKLWVIETKLERAIWQARLEERGESGPDNHRIHSWAEMEMLLARYDGCWHYDITPDQHILVDSSQDVAALVEVVLGTIMEDI